MKKMTDMVRIRLLTLIKKKKMLFMISLKDCKTIPKSST